jgi:feruloyl esterase
MAMGKRKRDRQSAMWVMTTDLPTAASHPFYRRLNQLLREYGFDDLVEAQCNTVTYYDSVVATVGAVQARNSVRLFMAPGMAHCRGGEGPPAFDPVAVIENWVEKGKTPDQIAVSRVRNGKPDRARTLCAYPQVAEYKGTGSTDDAGNFVCKTQ